MKVIYPGSFDPLTNGHMDIIERSLDKFDKVIIALLQNQLKKGLFSLDERVKLIADNYKGRADVEVKTFSGLLVDFCREEGVDVVVRGIRNMQDFEYESRLATLNRTLYPDLETVFLISKSEHSSISSSFIKDIASFQGDVSKFVPENVQKALEDKYGGEC